MNWRNDSTATNVALLSRWVYGALRPIVRILRSAGVSETAIAAAVKRANAEHEADTKRGRLGSGSRYESHLAVAAVISAWTRLPAWTDDSGNPRDLSINPKDPKGFAALVNATDPRLSAAAVLKELQDAEAVRLIANARTARLLKHSIGHASDDTFPVEPVLRDLQRFGETLEYNLFRDQKSTSGRMQLTAARQSIDPGKFDEFIRFMNRNGGILLESADDRLNAIEELPNGAGANFGVGVFVFYEDPSG